MDAMAIYDIINKYRKGALRKNNDYIKALLVIFTLAMSHTIVCFYDYDFLFFGLAYSLFAFL